MKLESVQKRLLYREQERFYRGQESLDKVSRSGYTGSRRG